MRVAWLVQGVGFCVLLWGLYYVAAHHPKPSLDTTSTSTPMAAEHMLVRSPAFVHEETIPSKYTCDGEDMSPPLAIDNVPEGTVSLALIMDDPDAPHGTWDHWVFFNIPPDTTRIGEGEEPAGIPGKGTAGSTTYQGPCPPDGEHRYLFKVYALDSILKLLEGSTKAEVEEAMQGHVLERTTLVGRYARPHSE